MLASAAHPAIVLRDELSFSSLFLRLSAIQSFTVVVTVAVCALRRFVGRTQGMSASVFRLITLITNGCIPGVPSV